MAFEGLQSKINVLETADLAAKSQLFFLLIKRRLAYKISVQNTAVRGIFRIQYE